MAKCYLCDSDQGVVMLAAPQCLRCRGAAAEPVIHDSLPGHHYAQPAPGTWSNHIDTKPPVWTTSPQFYWVDSTGRYRLGTPW